MTKQAQKIYDHINTLNAKLEVEEKELRESKGPNPMLSDYADFSFLQGQRIGLLKLQTDLLADDF